MLDGLFLMLTYSFLGLCSSQGITEKKEIQKCMEKNWKTVSIESKKQEDKYKGE